MLCGVLRHLLERQYCPKVLVATHFHDVFREGFLDPSTSCISFRHMQILFSSDDGTVLGADENIISNSPTESDNPKLTPGKITYLYKIAEGICLDSHAAKCASLFGLPIRVVRRAQHVSQLLNRHEVHVLLDEEMTEDEQNDLVDAESVCRRFLLWNLDSVNESDDLKKELAKCLEIDRVMV